MDTEKPPGAAGDHPAPLQAFCVNQETQPLEGVNDAQSGNLSWRTLISADRAPSTELTVGVADFPPHGRLNLHWHAPAEFYYGLSGEGTVTANGVPLKIAKGIAVFIPGNTEHGIEAGAAGLSILYGFAQRAFCDIVYHYTQTATEPPS
jgi:quercetin dioxygenase-like cupin family protein